MKASLIITFLAIAFTGCKHNTSLFEGKLVRELKLELVNVCIKLPDYRIIDTASGFGRTEVQGFGLSCINAVDSMGLLFVIRDYSFPELTKRNGNLELARDRAISHIELLLKQKNIIYDTLFEKNGYKIGYLKYFIDERQTDYVVKTGKRFYKSELFFFKDSKLISLSIEERFKDKKFDKYSLTDYIFDKIEYDCNR